MHGYFMKTVFFINVRNINELIVLFRGQAKESQFRAAVENGFRVLDYALDKFFKNPTGSSLAVYAIAVRAPGLVIISSRLSNSG